MATPTPIQAQGVQQQRGRDRQAEQQQPAAMQPASPGRGGGCRSSDRTAAPATSVSARRRHAQLAVQRRPAAPDRQQRCDTRAPRRASASARAPARRRRCSTWRPKMLTSRAQPVQLAVEQQVAPGLARRARPRSTGIRGTGQALQRGRRSLGRERIRPGRAAGLDRAASADAGMRSIGRQAGRSCRAFAADHAQEIVTVGKISSPVRTCPCTAPRGHGRTAACGDGASLIESRT